MEGKLHNYVDFAEMAEEIELHTQLSRRVGTTDQRLTELQKLPVRDMRFESFDEASFSRAHQKEIAEGSSGKLFTDFSVRFTELIVLLGRNVPWYHEQFEQIANPREGDPYCDVKKKQYMSCLIKMKQTEIARLRSVGRVEKAAKEKTRLSELKGLHQDLSNCDELLEQLEQLGNQGRNIILRVAPFTCIGLFLLLYVGNFTEVVSATVNDLKMEFSNDEMNSFDEVRPS